MSCTTVYRFDKLTWFPGYERLRKLHDRVIGPTNHNNIGPGGFLDVVLEWILEAHSHYLEHNVILTLHHVPRLTKHNKQALAYETEFLTLAIALWKKLPKTVTQIFPVRMDGQHIYLLIAYEPIERDLSMPEIITSLTVETFLRPSKKIRTGKQDMKTHKV